MNLKMIIIILMMIQNLQSDAQVRKRSYPVVGDTILNHSFTDLLNYPKTKVSIREFRGKWLILDAWSRTCTGCIRSFAKMDHLQKSFANVMQLIMVGVCSDKKYNSEVETERVLTKKLFENYRKQLRLNFTTAFDTAYGDKYYVEGLPDILIVNPQGVIVARTLSIDSSQFAQLIAGKTQDLTYKYSTGEPRKDQTYNRYLPLLTNGVESNGGIDTSFLFRSVLSKSSDSFPAVEYGFGAISWKPFKSNRFAEALKVDLERLVLISQIGGSSWLVWNPESLRKTYLNKVTYELSDTTVLNSNSLHKSVYNYSLCVPEHLATDEYKRSIMRSDLEKYFNIKISVELRDVPVFKLVIIDSLKATLLRSVQKERSVQVISPNNGRIYKYVSMSELTNGSLMSKAMMLMFTNVRDLQPLLFDETGINFNVDITVEADMSDFEAIRKSLQKNGLDIVSGMHKINCVIVRN